MIRTDVKGVVSRKLEKNEEALLPSIISQLEVELQCSKVPGIGLSAVQIGIPLRVAIIRIPNVPGYGDVHIDLWNPEIESTDGIIFHREGCLSLPGTTVTVKRARSVVVKNGDGKRYLAEGLVAACVQHEIDHMDGLTILDRRQKDPGRNDPCPCGSGRKWKKCCGK